MKRTAAIIGPTPAHLRWALEHACPWRRHEQRAYAESAARQLKILQEYSLARQQGRWFGGWCFRDPMPLNADQPVWGFSVNESLAPFGGLAHAEKVCGNCPANNSRAIDPNTRALASCFGWLQAMDVRPGQESQDQTKIVTQWSAAIQSRLESAQGLLNDWERLFPVTKTKWYGIVAGSPLSARQIELLLKVLSIADSADALLGIPGEWQQFLQAMDRAWQGKLPLHLEWINAGISDGLNWSLPSFCPGCKAPRPEAQASCYECDNRRHPEPERRRKVLGMRPYVDLRRVLGDLQAYKLHSQYLKSRQDLLR